MSQQSDGSHLENLSRANVLMGVYAELGKVGPLSRREIRLDSDLVSELNIDSLDAITILLALNTRFGVDLPNTLDTLRTPERIADEIIALTEAKRRLSALCGQSDDRMGVTTAQ